MQVESWINYRYFFNILSQIMCLKTFTRIKWRLLFTSQWFWEIL